MMNTSDFILDFDAFLRSFKYNIDTPFAFLLGAGASITSGVQSASDCIWDWKKEIYITNNPQEESFINIHSEGCKRKIQSWINNQKINPTNESEYEYYAERAFPIEGDRKKYFERICFDKTPYVGYKLLCLLNKYGVLKSVWTTNFDGLTERAAHQANITPICVTLDNPQRINANNESRNELLYVALHGDYKYSKLKNTSRELDSQEEIFVNRLSTYFCDKSLVVIGYSGRDKSLMSALETAFTNEGSGRLYWCGYGDYIPEEVSRLIKMVQAKGREAYYISTQGFDDVMISLMLSSYKEDTAKILEIKKILSSIGVTNSTTKFELPHYNPSDFIRTNLFPVVIPKDVFQFSVKYLTGDSSWSQIKDRIKGSNIVAVPFENKVYAFGYASDIENRFSDLMVDRIQRVPLSIDDINSKGPLFNLILNTLICGLSSYAGLNASLSKRIIWDKDKVFNSNDVYEAVKVDLCTVPNKKYALVSLTPTLYFSKGEAISLETKKDLTHRYLDSKRNKDYDSLMNIWAYRLFRGNRINFDYPKDSNNNFEFSISNNTGLVPVDYTLKGAIPEKAVSDPRTLFSGIWVDEPELEFVDKTTKLIAKDINHMRGLINNNPFDYKQQSYLGTSIKLAVICPKSKNVEFNRFLNRLNEQMPNDTKSDYVQPYLGFSKTYSCDLIIPKTEDSLWLSCNEVQTDAIILAQNICNHAKRLHESQGSDIVVILIPQSWAKHRSFKKESGETFDLHNYIKAFAVQNGFCTQIIEEKTMHDHRMKLEICWWLSLALYVKSLRNPWALSEIDNETAYAGIGYSLQFNLQGQVQVVLGCSHIYNSKGQGLRYKLSKIDNPIIDKKKNPYLHYEEAYKLGMSIQEQFIRSMDRMPKRVVIHKRTPFKEEEVKGIVDALAQANITNVDLISITEETKIRCTDQYLSYGHLSAAAYPVLRGICVPIAHDTFLLWTHGSVDSIRNARKYYAGGRGIPSPLRITKYHGTGDLQTLAREILGFTKMNWNSFNMYTKLPATIDTSNTLAKIGNMLTSLNGNTFDYRYFI